MASPFIGGGSVELSCASDGMTVYGADAFEPVANFWMCAIRDPVELADRAAFYYPIEKVVFYQLQKDYWSLENEIDKAAVFFVLNRASFSGSTFSGGMSPGHPRFTESAIDRMRGFRAPNLHVAHADYKETITRHPDKLLYLDPPYAIEQSLYGDRGDKHRGFEHEELAEILSTRDGWILSYNDCPAIRRMYERFDILTPEWAYGMGNRSQSREVLIVNL